MEPIHLGIEQFDLLDTERQGGMATVRKAVLRSSKQPCALKFLRKDGNQELAAMSFKRELEALANLDHRNIVKLIGVGTDGLDRFITLEWLEETLRERIAALGPLDWVTFYEQIGRPLLVALQYAHGRDIVHRDLKPMNIMFSRTGVPKITDFGIARDLAQKKLGLTLADLGSKPWTPPESDNGELSVRRDLYSWAAVCVACLTGRQDFAASSDVRAAAEKLGAVIPVAKLVQCLSDFPKIRPDTANELLWDLDDFHREKLIQVEKVRFLGVEILASAHEDLEGLLGDEQEVELRVKQFLDDFQPVCEVAQLPQGDFEILGRTMCLRGGRTGDSPWLLIKTVRLAGNEPLLEPRVEVTLTMSERSATGADVEQSRLSLDFLSGILETLEERQKEEQRRRDEERYLVMLQEVVAARTRALKDLPTLTYIEGRWEGAEYVVRVDGYEPPETGSRRVIRAGANINVFEIRRVARDRIFLRQVGPVRGVLQAQGVLEVDITAQRRALERQDDAIKAVRAEMTALPGLKRLLLKPETAEAPDQVVDVAPENFSEDKVAVLQAALGLRQILAVRGPPGTGKTTLITEILRRFLKQLPTARILVAAQTHIAIDHIISKLLDEPELKDRVVRIARAGDEKVAERVREVTLQQCVAGWCMRTAKNARQFAEQRAKQLKLDAGEVERAVRLEALLLATKRAATVVAQIAAGTASLENTGTATSAADLSVENATAAAMSVDELQEEAKRLAEMIEHLRNELRELGPDGQFIANAPDGELEECLGVIKGTGDVWSQLRREIEMQVSWLDLLGQLKQFEEPVLRSAAVVAGTCVGLGSIEALPGIKFDLCIIDEASKATPAEALVPMVRSERFLIVGDPKQLPPFDSGALELDDYSDSEAKETLLDYLLSRLPSECVFQLTHQHRMCEGIGELISHAFYNKTLVNKRPDSQRPGWLQNIFPKPVVWIDSYGSSQKRQGYTYVNRGEQDIVLEVLKRLQHGAGRAKAQVSVSVIAAYAAQAHALDASIQKSAFGSLFIEVATVDSFQGRETDVTVFSVTLSNDSGWLGFLRSANRLNVALSRPRDLLVIVGDQRFCYAVEEDNPFEKVIDHIDNHPKTCETRNVK